MIEMASDHYALDVSRARELLGWRPRHDLREELDALITSLERDPLGWYERNGITPPVWLEGADERGLIPEAVRAGHDAQRLEARRSGRWAHLLIIALGTWLLVSPASVGIDDPWMRRSDFLSGALLVLLGTLSPSAALVRARFAVAAVGFWLLWAPLACLTPNAAAYLNDTLVGGLAIGLALAVPPMIGPSALATQSGPLTPTGWSFNPSSWLQRMPIIALAFVGLYFSRYLAAYQLEQVDGVWELFFEGDPQDPKNGTEEIVTSAVSEAWPVPDAGVGAVTYMLEIVTGAIGGVARWRTMPWLVLLFGIMIVPLGAVVLCALSVPRGAIHNEYGRLGRYIVRGADACGNVDSLDRVPARVVGARELRPFHPGEIAVRRPAGERDRAVLNGRVIQTSVPAAAAAFVGARSFCALATRAADGETVAALVAAPVGFAGVSDDRQGVALALDWAPRECRRGECGSCAVQVLEGEPDHRDVCLSPAQRRDLARACVSRARTPRPKLALQRRRGRRARPAGPVPLVTTVTGRAAVLAVDGPFTRSQPETASPTASQTRCACAALR